MPGTQLFGLNPCAMGDPTCLLPTLGMLLSGLGHGPHLHQGAQRLHIRLLCVQQGHGNVLPHILWGQEEKVSGPLSPLASCTCSYMQAHSHTPRSFPCLLLAPRNSFPKHPGPPSCQVSAWAFSAGYDPLSQSMFSHPNRFWTKTKTQQQ